MMYIKLPMCDVEEKLKIKLKYACTHIIINVIF
jgi:hypothetical protein